MESLGRLSEVDGKSWWCVRWGGERRGARPILWRTPAGTPSPLSSCSKVQFPIPPKRPNVTFFFFKLKVMSLLCRGSSPVCGGGPRTRAIRIYDEPATASGVVTRDADRVHVRASCIALTPGSYSHSITSEQCEQARPFWKRRLAGWMWGWKS